MPFKKKSENGGEVDKNQWRGGRGWYDFSTTKPNPTYKDLGRDELLKLYRKVKPHTKLAMDVITTLMINPDTTEGTRLKAAALILTQYSDLIKSIYDREDLIDPDELVSNEPATVFSLKVIGGKEVEKSVKNTEVPKELLEAIDYKEKE